MKDKPIVALAEVKINGIENYTNLLSIAIDTEKNNHSYMTVRLRLDAEAYANKERDWNGQQIEAVVGNGRRLFIGECINYEYETLSQYQELSLYVVSESYQSDISPNSRTLQNPGKTLSDVAHKVFDSYDAEIIIEKDIVIKEILVQEKETDWRFFIRIANQYGYQVYTDASSEKQVVGIGKTGMDFGGLWQDSLCISEEKNVQEYRLKSVNYAQETGLYQYESKEALSYNPYGMAGATSDGAMITKSHLSSEKGVLNNKIASSNKADDTPNMKNMEVDGHSSHVLSGTVLSVNGSLLKVKFDVDAEQSEAEAMELPYENTICNSFYFMPELGDKVFGYIDNRGKAIILGCKRKDTVDSFFMEPREKAVTVLDNMIQFKENNFEFLANREDSDENRENRISVNLDKETGIDIHAKGKITLYSDKTVGLWAGSQIQDIDSIISKYDAQSEEGRTKYDAECVEAPLQKASWLAESGKQIGDSFVAFWKGISFSEARKDFMNWINGEEIETEYESFETGKLYFGGEAIVFRVGESCIVLAGGNDESGEFVSSIYINSELFNWLGFVKKSGYERVENDTSDMWDFILDVTSIVLDIVATVLMCVCPLAGFIVMGVNVAMQAARGDYCGALLSAIPFATEIGAGAKIAEKVPKLAKVVNAIGISCKVIDKATGVLMMANQVYTTIKSIATGNFTWKDATMIGLQFLSVFVGKKCDDYKKNHPVDLYGNPIKVDAGDGGSVKGSVDGDDGKNPVDGGDGKNPVDGGDGKNPVDGGDGKNPVDGDDGKKSNDQKKPDDEKKPDDQKKSDDEKKPDDQKKSDDEKKPDDQKKADDEKKPDDQKKSDDEKKPDDQKKADDEKKPDDQKKADDKKKPDDQKKSDDQKKTDNTKTKDTDADPQKENQTAADPVNVVTGALTDSRTDFRLKDVMDDFRVIRTYNSTRINKGRMLGERWLFQFETSFFREGDKGSLYLPDNHKEQFVKDRNGRWKNAVSGRNQYLLEEDSKGYLVKDYTTQRTYRYGRSGFVEYMADGYGNKVRFSYTGILLNRITLESGMYIDFLYKGDKLVQLKDNMGRTYHYQYEGDLLESVTYPNGGTIRYEYTPEGYLSRVFNENGKCYVSSHYDRKGRVIRQETADGEEYIFFYNPAEKVNTVTTTKLNRTIKHYYNRNNLVERTEFGDGTTEEKKYDSNEKVIWEKDRLGRETTREFNVLGLLLKEIKPNGLTTTYQYNESGKCTYQEDSFGRKLAFEYDEGGMLISSAFLLEEGKWAKTEFERDSHGRIVSQTYPDGSRKTWKYGKAFSHPTVYQGPIGEEFRYELDEYGRKMIFHGARGDVHYGYNSNHFLTLIRDEENNCIRYQYDLTGNKTGILLPEDVEADDGKKISYQYDPMDHLIATEDESGVIQANRVNSEGKVIKAFDAVSYDKQQKDGLGVEHAYDEDGRNTHIYYQDGSVQKYVYDACGNIVKNILPCDYNQAKDDGPGISYEYDEMNRLSRVIDREGRIVRKLYYDLTGNLIKEVTDKTLQISTEKEIGTLYTYNLAGWLTEARVPVSFRDKEVKYRLCIYQYDIRGNLTTEKRFLEEQSEDSARGKVLLINRSYDRASRLIKVTDSLGSCIEYQYDYHNKMISERTKIREGVYQEKLYSYTKSGKIEKIAVSADKKATGRAFAVTKYEYDKNGNVTRILTPSGNELCYTYDRAGKKITAGFKQKDGAIQTIMEYQYDKGGRMIQVFKDGRCEHAYGYDCRGRLHSFTNKSGKTAAYIYDADGHVIKEIGERSFEQDGFDGKGMTYEYKASRLIAVRRPDGTLEKEYRYNEFNEPEYIGDGNGGIHIQYDLAGRKVKAVSQNGARQLTEYDPWDHVSAVTDGNGNTTRFSLDGWGKITEIERADGAREIYEYDNAGNICQAIDGLGHAIQFLYNNQNKMEKRIDQAGCEEIWSYDAEGRPCRHCDRNGNETGFTYNIFGSLTRKWVEGSEKDSLTFGYEKDGKISYAIGGGMRYDYEYDTLGRLSCKKASGRTLLAYTYDEYDRLIGQTDFTGKHTEYQYDHMDRLEAVLDQGIRQISYEYTAQGQLKNARSGLLESSYEYDTEGNTKAVRTLLDQELLVDNHYSYDANGNCIQKETLSGITRYAYDCMNRLREVSYPWGREQFTYDQADNRIQRVHTVYQMDKTACPDALDMQGSTKDMDAYGDQYASQRGVTYTDRYFYDERNRLVRAVLNEGPDTEGISREYAYDANGNLLNDGVNKYEYDAYNRMTEVRTQKGEVQVNRYDAEGLRHEMEENGRLVQFLYKGKEVVAEEGEKAGVVRYIRGLGLVSSDSEEARTYYHYASDELGSITHIVKAAVHKKLEEDGQAGEGEKGESKGKDKDCQVLNCYAYDAFGNRVECEEQVANRFGFAGELYDPVSALVYLRARFYNPVIGRFLQEDNVYEDGLNLYVYCRNNPVRYVDPSGHGTESPADKDGGGKEDHSGDIEALKEIVDEVNAKGGATPDEAAILKEWADEYGVDYDSLGVKIKAPARVPGRVQSRINIANGRTKFTPLRKSGEPVSAGFNHVLDGHFNRPLGENRSIFSISPDDLKTILQNPDVVSSPVEAIPGGQYVRVVDTGQIVGNVALKFGGGETSWIKIFTDEAGNLITTYPVPAPN